MECKIEATHNDMPGASKTLRVTGTCSCPSTGYNLSFKPGNPGTPGIPDTYVLDLIVEAPEIGNDTITETPIEPYVDNDFPEVKTLTVRAANPSVITIQHLQ